VCVVPLLRSCAQGVNCSMFDMIFRVILFHASDAKVVKCICAHAECA